MRATIVALLLLLTPAPMAGASEPVHLSLGQRLVDELPSPSAANVYGAPAAVRWAGIDGASETASTARCASLMTQLLSRAYGYSAAEMQAWFGSASPTAAQYRSAIASGKAENLEPVAHVADLRPGDLVAIEYADDQGDEDTGHVVLVASAPIAIPGGPALPGAQPYRVDVIDATKTPHGSGDTRRFLVDGAWQNQQGVGRGSMRVFAGPDGSPAGYTWTTSVNSEVHPVTERPMALARPTGPGPAVPLLPVPAGDPPPGTPTIPGALGPGFEQPESRNRPSGAHGTSLRFTRPRTRASTLRRTRRLSVGLRSDRAVAGTVALRVHRRGSRRLLARASVALAADVPVRVRLRLPRKAASLVRARRVIVLSFAPSSGSPASTKRRLSP